MTQKLSCFFSYHPALHAGLIFLLGLCLSQNLSPALLPFCLILFLPSIKSPTKLLPLLLLCSLAFIYGKWKEEKLPNDLTSFTGTVLFCPSEIKTKQTHYKKSYLVKGTILSTQENPNIERIRCSIPLSPSLRPLKAGKYLISGTLENQDTGLSFSPTPNKNWTPISGSFSFIEERFALKEFLKKKIHQLYPSKQVADFLTALTIGDLSDPLLRFSFGRLGLQHILAISGFHFSLLALFLGFFFRLFLKGKIFHIALLCTLTAYFALIGYSPSILRAYLGASLYLVGRLGNWRCSGLNILGATLLFELILVPESLKSIGFQLSFLATGSILLLYPLTFLLAKKIFPIRSSEEALLLKNPDRWIYLFCCFLRSTLGLNLSVHITMIPTCLILFGKFPLSSLAYNLFIPIGVCLTLFLFLTSLPLLILPPLATSITLLNNCFTKTLLSLITEAPNCFNVYLKANLPTYCLLILLPLLFLLPVLLSTRTRETYS
jgi:competence protein ComEC